ncbi:flagellar assembly protein FliX [Rhodospirillum rubrum]|uniref:Flagellar assembly protein FliX n=1 Tax=Rhodospirillum rubrum (strain ATCC 11170 / ATH 1.1.1 / DSM 467 / LMG 4362 / NCIMB 8255 / S1) TaxID=269796 RepID=Q2RQF0_RHORT|nr:flagellar assembly protein FliX [Rhodospirillum rubrum]ABC23645.1 hypothetical protein Rru_A2848 [Rhodospirillum rubrum ATCC 11170]AEO49383.1 flagellar assembly regulator FliX [Rhodospirillum rubrum F11]MBK5955321.1 flagellar assembly protein FliX [Rhodospirillum rubrum]QXG79605.1 flagellar assembly protein FliX [Rhodospirillum rubrum]HAP98660.1 flagellar assembly protein FliX [Rhodospirillum rubrum]
MKIGGIRPGESAPTRKSEKSGKAEKGVFGNHLRRALDDEDDGEGGALEAASAIAGVGGLLALQEADSVDASDPGERRRRQARPGVTMLDELDRLRIAVIDGVVSKDDLIALARSTRSRRDANLDPQLGALLDEIELRVEVELAKLTSR